MASSAPSGSADDGGPYGTQGFLVDNSRKFSPTMALVIIVLLAGCFVLAFLSVVVRRCFRERAAVQAGQSSGSYPTKLTRGLEKADVEALPLVRGADLGEMDEHECPVCLTEFVQDDTVRLLPACKHVFHQQCIDAWFDSHSTCPLCRASLVGGQDSSTVPEATPHVTRIHEASENEDSDTEVHGGARHGASSRGLPGSQALSSVISRGGSVRGSLVRNSESEAAHESAADVKAPSFRKPSSLSADLVSLRNLLMGADESSVVTASEASMLSARGRSLELNSKKQSPTQDEWVTIDLESGKAAEVQLQPSTSSECKPGRTAAAAAPERSWSDRFSLSRIRSLKGIAMLSRSSSDLSSRHASPLPM